MFIHHWCYMPCIINVCGHFPFFFLALNEKNIGKRGEPIGRQINCNIAVWY